MAVTERPLLWGVGDASRPIGERGYTADVFEKPDGWHVGLVAWSPNGLGSEVYDSPLAYPTRDDAAAAAPEFLKLWEKP